MNRKVLSSFILQPSSDDHHGQEKRPLRQFDGGSQAVSCDSSQATMAQPPESHYRQERRQKQEQTNGSADRHGCSSNNEGRPNRCHSGEQDRFPPSAGFYQPFPVPSGRG